MRICLPLAVLAIALAVLPVSAESPLIEVLDTNHDGAVESGEVLAAANAAFDRMSGPLPDSLRERFRRKFLASVARWFRAADLDGSGRLEGNELELPGGQKLARLLSRPRGSAE
jgi:hypothetical protein